MTGVPALAGSTTAPSFSSDVQPEVKKDASGLVNAVDLGSAPAPRPDGVGADASPTKIAQAHLKTYAGKFGVKADNLKAVSSNKLAGGNVVRFDQQVDGVKVFGGQLVASLDRRGGLEFVVGKTEAKADASFPDVSSKLDSDTVEAVKQAVKKAAELKSTDGMSVKAEGKIWYSAELSTGAKSGDLVPARDVKVTAKGHPDIAYRVFVDAKTGEVVNAYNTINNAIDRAVCDAEEQPIDDSDAEAFACGWSKGFEPVRSEGDEPTGQSTVDNVYDWQEDFSKRFAAYVNLDVTQHIGQAHEGESDKKLNALVRACTASECPYSNAFWNGYQATFGDGLTSDDFVAHEFAHGVTQHTAGLVYQDESGAINEAFSDIWGELVDQYNGDDDDTPENAWQLGEGSPLGEIRNMADPPNPKAQNDYAHPQPDSMTSDLYYTGSEDNGGVHVNSGVLNKAAFLLGQPNNASTEFNGQTVRSIGPAKLAKVVFSTQNILTENANHRDLFETMPLACQKYIDAPKSYVTADDCKQVEAAVKATAMDQAPPAARK